MKVFLLCNFFFLFFISCGGKAQEDKDQDTSLIDSIEPEMTCPALQPLFVKRRYDQLTPQLRDIMSVISLSTVAELQGNLRLYGSFSIPNINRFPGDIDLIENIIYEGTSQQAAEHYSNLIANMMRRIKTRKDVIFSDFKAGFDARFLIDIGQEKQGSYEGYFPDQIRAKIKAIESSAWKNIQEKNELLGMVKDRPSYSEWQNLSETLRLLYTIRWNQAELLNQTKVYRGKKITLAQAIMGSQVKIDVFSYVCDGREGCAYVEITNFFSIQLRQDGRLDWLTLFSDPVQSLSSEVFWYTLSDESDKLKDTLKGSKRLFSLARQVRDYELIVKLYPLFQGTQAGLRQVLGDIETLKSIIALSYNTEKGPLQLNCLIGTNMMSTIGSFYKRIEENYPEVDMRVLSSLLNPIEESFLADNCSSDTNSLFGRYVSDRTKTVILDNLRTLYETLKPVVNQKTIAYLTQVGVDPASLYSALTGRSMCPASL